MKAQSPLAPHLLLIWLRPWKTTINAPSGGPAALPGLCVMPARCALAHSQRGTCEARPRARMGGWMETVREQAGVAVLEPPELSGRAWCVSDGGCSAPHPRSGTERLPGKDASGASQVIHLIVLQQESASCVTALRCDSSSFSTSKHQ